MIDKLVRHIGRLLEEYLGTIIPSMEDTTKVSFIGKDVVEAKNRLVISLFGIERETAGGIVPTRKSDLNNSTQKFPPLLLNLNLLFAAVYDEINYTKALEVISSTLLFLQTHPSIKFKNATYTLEILSPNSQELNNIWSTMGGQYYPSVLCKLRRVIIDAEEVQNTGGVVKEIDIEITN